MIYTLKSPTWTDLKPQTAHQARQVTTGHTRVISPENDRGGVQPHRECDGDDVPQVVSLKLGYTVRSEARCRSTSLPQAGYVSCTCAVETKEARWETQDGVKVTRRRNLFSTGQQSHLNQLRSGICVLWECVNSPFTPNWLWSRPGFNHLDLNPRWTHIHIHNIVSFPS